MCAAATDSAAQNPDRRHVFILSPANLSGRRAGFLLGAKARSDLALRLRAQSASLGQVFSFISGLYFRGKLTYANAFCDRHSSRGAVFIITSAHGLVSPEALTSCDQLREMADSPIHPSNPRYTGPLERDVLQLAAEIGADARCVLLGSVATPKYLQPLVEILGNRVMIPSAFVGLGDMARGSLLLRSVREVRQLSYVTVTSGDAFLKRKAKDAAPPPAPAGTLRTIVAEPVKVARGKRG